MHERQELGSIQDKLPKSTTWLWQLREKLLEKGAQLVSACLQNWKQVNALSGSQIPFKH